MSNTPQRQPPAAAQLSKTNSSSKLLRAQSSPCFPSFVNYAGGRSTEQNVPAGLRYLMGDPFIRPCVLRRGAPRRARNLARPLFRYPLFRARHARMAASE